MENKDRLWPEIVEVFQYTKSLLILAEENTVDEDFKTFIQPLTEIRSAMDHICRAQSLPFGLIKSEDVGDTDNSYTKKNFNKALGHIYRAFFDTADFMGITFRRYIREELQEFKPSIISQALPKYYSQTRPALEKLNRDIAGIREKKDITKNHTIALVEKYNDIIQGLLDDYIEIISAKEALIAFKKEAKAKKIFNFILTIAGGILIGLSVWYITEKIKDSKNIQLLNKTSKKTSDKTILDLQQ